MPQLHYFVPDIEQMITRPVITAVTNQIIEATGMSPDTFIEYTGDQQQTTMYRSFIDKEPINAVNNVRFPFYEKIQVEVDDNPLEEFLLSTPWNYPDNKRVWWDDKLGIILEPVYERSEVTLNFTYRTPDKGSAARWQKGMQRRFKIKFTDMSMVASYNILLPRLIVKFLYDFWKMRETVEGYGDTWSDYFNNHAMQKMVKLTDQSGKNPEIAIDETQLDILGNFEFTTAPKEERQDDGSAYTIGFSYKFRFDRPVGFNLHYPLVIHNQMIPSSMRNPKPHSYDPRSILGNATQSTSRYDAILRQQAQSHETKIGGHLVPWFDDWKPKVGYKNTSPLLQTLIRIDETNPYLVLDIMEMAEQGLIISPNTLTYLRMSYRFLNKHSMAALYIGLYSNDNAIDHQMYYITEDLKIMSRVKLDLRKCYHVVFFLINDLFGMTQDATKVLQRNPDIAEEILTTLEPTIANDLPKRLGDKFISRDEWQRVVSKINTSSSWYGREQFLIRPTVLGAMIRKMETK